MSDDLPAVRTEAVLSPWELTRRRFARHKLGMAALRLDYQRATVELTHLYSYTRDNWKFTPVPPAQDDGLLEAWHSFPPDVGSTHGAQLNAFVSDMDANRRPLTSGEQARLTLELLTAIYKSGFTGEIVARGSIKPGDPFYTALHGHQAPKRVKGEAPRAP